MRGKSKEVRKQQSKEGQTGEWGVGRQGGGNGRGKTVEEEEDGVE